jgi:PAP2 superfamily
MAQNILPPFPSLPVVLEPARPAKTNVVASALWRFAAQDWLVASYLMVLTVAVAMGAGPRRSTALTMMVADSAMFWTCLLIARSDLGRFRFVGDILYRVGLVGAVVATFLQLHYILPSVSHLKLDAQILQLDLAVFGFEPSVSWDRYVTPARTEWFSFFYYSYFFILSLFVVPMGLFEKRIRILSELSFGLLFVVCVGHCLYVLVPGRGPYLHLEGQFQHALSGGFWWPLVAKTVRSVDGALRTDIFPSLHTACPTFLTLFAFRNRAHRPYRYIWPVTAFFTSQIILATLFLRWHYLLDVCAGLTLATTAFVLSSRVVSAEARERVARDLGPVWRGLSFS